MRKTQLKRRGKKTTQWGKVRAKLKVFFQTAGITTCELRYPGCWYSIALGFAHLKKRRNLKPHELFVAILACNPCHDRIEILPEAEMTKIVQDVIEKRNEAIQERWKNFLKKTLDK